MYFNKAARFDTATLITRANELSRQVDPEGDLDAVSLAFDHVCNLLHARGVDVESVVICPEG